YKLPLSDAYAIEPFAGVAWNQIRTRGFQETGGSAALRGQSNTDDVTSTTLGLRGAMLIGTDSAPGRLTATVGWRHAMGDVKPTQKLAFEGGSTFTVSGVPIAKNAAVLGLGAEVAITRSTTAGVAYDAGRWRAALTMNNLFDKQYYAGGVRNAVALGDGRT
ncbi:autotransporter domain-containing protein, partial [Paenibacillus polymyxa]|nr:autotransporter domain-containing protein [Paenibacillus polymyxa]